MSRAKFFIQLLIYITWVFAACSKKGESKNPILSETVIKGTIHFQSHIPPDSIYVGLYPISTLENFMPLGKPDTIFSITDTTFNICPKAGRYTLSVFAFGFQPLRTPLVIPDSTILQNVNIFLQPVAIDTNIINYVKVFGDFNGWNIFRGVSLKKSGKVWTLEATSIMKKGDKYKLFPYKNNSNYYDMNNDSFRVVPEFTSFNSIYKGGKIIFDPALYSSQTKNRSSAQFDGWRPQLIFNQVMDFVSMKNTDPKIRALMSAKDEKRDSLFFDWYNQFNDLQNSEDSIFADILIKEKWNVISARHPAILDRVEQINDSQKIVPQIYYNTDEYRNYAKLIYKTLSEIDSSFAFKLPPEPLLDLDRAIKYIPDLIDNNPNEIEAQLEFNLGRFADIALSWEKTAPDTESAVFLLWRLAQDYNDHGEYEKLKWVLRRIVAKYPTSQIVQEGWIKKIGQNMQLEINNPIPSFEVNSTDSLALRISDIKTPYIFIYIWAPACFFSLSETENVSSLRDKISPDKLFIIGLANAPSIEDLRAFIKIKDINFPNMLMDDALMEKLGVVAYPTSYLIGPNRKIIARDLRGSNLTERIIDLMDD